MGIQTRSMKEFLESGEIEAIKMKPIATPSTGEGTIYYDDAKNCHSTLSDIPDVTFNIPLEQCTRVINKTGLAIPNGVAVRLGAPDATTGLPTIITCMANSYAFAKTHGITTHIIANNDEAWVTTSGDVGGVDLVEVAEAGQTLVVGQPLYLSATHAGKMTHVPPNIVTKLGAFTTGESGVSDGTLSVLINANMALPSVLGVLTGNTSVISLTGTPQAIANYTAEDAVGFTSDNVAGTITTTQKAFCNISFTAASTFAGVSSTRKIWLHVVPSISASFTIPIPLARDIDESSLPVALQMTLDTSETVQIEISADDNFDLTLTNANFSVSAIHVLV